VPRMLYLEVARLMTRGPVRCKKEDRRVLAVLRYLRT
jgi:hypothetical protein